MINDAFASGRPVHFAIHATDTTRALAVGGTVAMPKAALPGMARQGYFLDGKTKIFGVHDPDPDAQ